MEILVAFFLASPILAFLLWLGLAGLVGYLAGEKGRHRVFWFLLAIAASPIVAALFLLVAGPTHPGQHGVSVGNSWQSMVDDLDEPTDGGRKVPPQEDQPDTRFNPFG